jgi:HSP20 family protein
MAIIRWNDPFSSVSSLHDDLDNLFNGFFTQPWPVTSATLPAMDVYTEDDKQLVSEVHLPGYTKDDVTINVHDGVLEIKGEVKAREEQKDKKRSYMLRQSSSSFYRRLALPKNADADKVKAELKDGLLKVVVPFKSLPAPKKVAITESKK